MFTYVPSNEIETYENIFVNTGDNKLVAWTSKVNDIINIEYINKISFIVFISRIYFCMLGEYFALSDLKGLFCYAITIFINVLPMTP